MREFVFRIYNYFCDIVGKKIYIRVAAMLLVLCLGISTAGCQDKTGSNKKIEIKDRVEIPVDGIIKAELFEAFAGTDRTVVFYGECEGIEYEWAFSGKNIHNPVDMNLAINFIVEDKEIDNVKAIAGNATYAIGMELKGNELVTIPTLTVTIPQKWDADTAVFCKNVDNTAMRLSDAQLSNSKTNTSFSVDVTEVGDTYYVVGGLSKAAVAKREQADKKKADNLDDNKKPADKKKQKTCTISISCATILSNMDKLDKDRVEFVPKSGWILSKVQVAFEDGDNVFDVLTKVCKEKGIHMEHSYTPVYGSEYIEGINQLYEFNCGELSGWMFSVNGWFPNYGCDKFQVSDGDNIAWVYTCDLGKDVGGRNY